MAAERSQSLFPTEASSWCKGTIPVPVCLPSSGTWLEWVDPAARYCANSLEASAWSMGAINLRASGISESSRLRAVLERLGGNMRVHASDHLFGNVDLYLVYLQFQNPARTSWKIGTKLSNANAFACALMSKTLCKKTTISCTRAVGAHCICARGQVRRRRRHGRICNPPLQGAAQGSSASVGRHALMPPLLPATKHASWDGRRAF